MPAATFDIIIEAGATYKMAITVRNDQSADATPLDLTGFVPHMQIRPSASSLDVLLDCNPDNARLVVLNAQAGRLLLDIPAATTSRLDFSVATYDLKISSPAVVRRLLQGMVTISPAVTR